MPTPDLIALRERVRNAKGADREIEARLWCALFPDQRVLLDPGSVRPPKREPVYGVLRDLDLSSWRDWVGLASIIQALPVTSSLDAAVALCARLLPGWTIASLGQNDHKNWFCELREGYLTSYDNVIIEPRDHFGAPNGALAVIAAALSAFIAQQEVAEPC